ncbi:SGNH/GDSL hydrolase family protein [Sphaerotilaceae bacterium SBD11-9]
MKFKVDVVRSVVMAGLAAVVLASCGGSTEIEAFVPRRIISFGDENSLIQSDGSKFTVNWVDPVASSPTFGTVDCAGNQVWTQILAASFGLAFPQCPNGVVGANGEMRAAAGATVAVMRAQVDAFLSTPPASGVFTKSDLVTVMVGMNDVLEQYRRWAADPSIGTATVIAAVQAAGNEAGAQVVRITDLGAKVVVSTIPNVGAAPFGAEEELAHPGEGRSALLTTLSKEFNTRLRLKLEDVRDGGHAVGLILSDELFLSMTQVPWAYGLNVIYPGACDDAHSDVDLPTCTSNTLRNDALGNAQANRGADWLWADDTRMGATAHERVGGLAVNRAHSNPF